MQTSCIPSQKGEIQEIVENKTEKHFANSTVLVSGQKNMITFIQFFSKIKIDLWSGGIFCRTRDTPKQNCKESIVKESNWSLLFQYTQIQTNFIQMQE